VSGRFELHPLEPLAGTPLVLDTGGGAHAQVLQASGELVA